MDPPLFVLEPSGEAPLLTLRISRTLFFDMAIAPEMTMTDLVHRTIYSWLMVAFKMGRWQGGPSRTGAKGAYLNLYVTDEQRSRRPIFIATLRTGAQLAVFPRCSLDPYDSNMGALLAP